MKFRLLSAHQLPGDLYVYGDKEAESEKGLEGGSIVDNGTVIAHDGKRFSIDMKEFKPTLEMVALDTEAEEALEEEYKRLQRNQNTEQGVAIVPLDQLPKFVENYEKTYTPGGFVKKAVIALAIMLTATPVMAQAPGPYNEVLNQGRAARAVTPSDTVDFALGPTRGLYNGGAAACAIAVILADDTAAVTLSNVPSGSFMPIRAKRVMATNTACTGIVGLW